MTKRPRPSYLLPISDETTLEELFPLKASKYAAPLAPPDQLRATMAAYLGELAEIDETVAHIQDQQQGPVATPTVKLELIDGGKTEA